MRQVEVGAALGMPRNAIGQSGGRGAQSRSFTNETKQKSKGADGCRSQETRGITVHGRDTNDAARAVRLLRPATVLTVLDEQWLAVGYKGSSRLET